ncbi:hypothetical protein [Radiobacillus sp. PE A8.2]|uniref:hypothetical protein n=1 Tax=Radiobacillus sp. PE A8.2 TaxID=3380349 RepID=UPI00388DC253
MDLLKRLALILFTILFLVSVFKDLTQGTVVNKAYYEEQQQTEADNSEQSLEQNQNPTKNIENEPQQDQPYETIRIYPKPGDTVLSIVEDLNQNTSTLKMNQIIDDFVTLNPDANPHQINPKTAYYFPVYPIVNEN